MSEAGKSSAEGPPAREAASPAGAAASVGTSGAAGRPCAESAGPVDVPPIYAPPTEPIRVKAGRWLAAFLALLFLAPLLVGAWLEPVPGGAGTHLQLGLSPCSSLVASDFPCISCGMTTSVTYFAHGNWLASLYVQPAGFVFALVLCAAFWVAAYIAATGRPVHRLLMGISLRWSLLLMSATVLGGWGWKIYIHARGLDGW